MLHRDHQDRWNYHRCKRCCNGCYGICCRKEQYGCWRSERAQHDLVSDGRLDGEDEDETDAPCEAADTAEGAGETAEEQEETAEKE